MLKLARRLKRWWRSRLDVPIDCGDSGATVSSSVEGGVTTIVISGGPNKGTFEVMSRWYDTPTTIAWKLRRATTAAPRPSR